MGHEAGASCGLLVAPRLFQNPMLGSMLLFFYAAIKVRWPSACIDLLLLLQAREALLRGRTEKTCRRYCSR